VIGSISLKGARIDDLSLVKFRDTVDPTSPPIVLYSPSNTASALLRRVRLGPGIRLDHAEFPTRPRFWQQEGIGSLSPGHPVTLNSTMATASPSAAPFRSTTAISSP